MRFSLRTLLIALNLFVFVLPIAGIQILRLYESALVRQTESTLIAQSAFISAFYRSLLQSETQDWVSLSAPLPPGYSKPNTSPWIPQPPTLDLATSTVYDPFPDPIAVKSNKLSLSLVADKLNPTLKDAQLTTLAGIRVVDTDGVIVASTGTDLGQSIAHGPEIAAALNGKSTSRLRTKSDVVDSEVTTSLSRTSGVRVFVASPIILQDRLVGAVLLSRTPPSIVQALYAKRWLLAQSLGLVMLLVVSMSLLAHRLITRPIKRIVDTAEQISEGRTQNTTRLKRREPAITELSRLQQSIVQMGTTLEARAEYLRDFVRQITHEFKTPLAGIKGATELIEEHSADMSEAQLRRFLDNIASDTDRLQALTERLNQLTQAELSPEHGISSPLSAVIKSLQNTFKELAFTVDAAHDFEVDKSHTYSAIEILLSNAVQHGATQVSVTLSEKELSIQNNGDPISQGNVDKVFVPFFTTKRENGGTGLGLSIAQTLLKKTGADLELTRADPVTFTIRWD